MASIPPARGELSAALIGALRQDPHELEPLPVPRFADPIADEDLQLALYLCYELHYRGLDGVSDEWEWEPSLLRLRAQLEARFEQALRDEVGASPEAVEADSIDRALRALSERDGPSLSTYIRTRATAEQLREFIVHRSAYQLKEADPHSWAIPRLAGRPKAALIEVQADEYGGGRPDWMHAALFAQRHARRWAR